MDTILNNLLPVVSTVIAIISLIFVAVRYGREVHVDDKNEILRQLSECRTNCQRLATETSDMRKEIKRLTDINLDLMQRLLKLNGGRP